MDLELNVPLAGRPEVCDTPQGLGDVNAHGPNDLAEDGGGQAETKEQAFLDSNCGYV